MDGSHTKEKSHDNILKGKKTLSRSERVQECDGEQESAWHDDDCAMFLPVLYVSLKVDILDIFRVNNSSITYIRKYVRRLHMLNVKFEFLLPSN